MNITLLSLASSSLFSHSPFFVGNKLNFINVRFNKISSIIFFNKQKLNINFSTFNQIYGGIIYNEYENDHIDFSDTYTNDKRFDIGTISGKKSITILNCNFHHIYANNGNPLLISNDQISIYITNTIFHYCQSNNGVIYLDRCHCLTMTHVCSFESNCQSNNCFLFYQCNLNDFSIFLYNSIVQSTLSQHLNNRATFNVLCRSGDQYFRCNNMTQLSFNAFHFNNPRYLSFAMTTVMTCALTSFHLAGHDTEIECNNIIDKEIEMVNFYTYSSDGAPLIRLSVGCMFNLAIKNSVLLAQSNKIIEKDDDKKFVNVFLYNCIFKGNMNEYQVIESDCSSVNDLNTKYFNKYPFFTTTICVGPEYETKFDAYRCNVENCIPSDRTIGFPDDVIPYTKINHADFQQPTSLASDNFSKSFDFSPSNDFSVTNKFTYSNYFSYSNEFSASSDLPFQSKEQLSIETLSTEIMSSDQEFSSSDFLLSSEDEKLNSEPSSASFYSSSEFDNILPSSVSDSSIIGIGPNLGNAGGKNKKGKMIGIIVGVVAAVAIVVIITTVILIRKRKMMDSMSEGDVITQEETAISVDNALNGEMDKDDPFDADFQDN